MCVNVQVHVCQVCVCECAGMSGVCVNVQAHTQSSNKLNTILEGKGRG